MAKKKTAAEPVASVTAQAFHMSMSTTNGTGVNRSGTIDEVAGRYLIALSRGVEMTKGPGLNIGARGRAGQDVMRDTMAEAMDLLCKFTLGRIDLPVPKA